MQAPCRWPYAQAGPRVLREEQVRPSVQGSPMALGCLARQMRDRRRRRALRLERFTQQRAGIKMTHTPAVTAQPAQVSPALLSPYAPVRYRDVAWWRFAKQLAKAGQVQSDGRVRGGLFEYINQELVLPALDAGKQAGFDDAELGHLLTKVHAFRGWVPLAAQYELCGRQIFDFDSALVETFVQTDIKDATLEDLHLPYQAFYLRFGPQPHAQLPFEDESAHFEMLDGVFVSTSVWDNDGRTRLCLGMTTVRDSGGGMWLPGYYADVAPDEQSLPCAEAVERSIARHAAVLREAPWPEGARSHLLHALDESAALLRSSLPLVINALFYLDSLGKTRDLPVEPGKDVPSELRGRWSSASPRQREKLRSRLTSEGYTVVRVLGRDELSSEERAHIGRGPAAPCWRRGHWRWQVHGPRNSLRKRIWVRPVFVNPGGRPADDVPGHIYSLNEPSR